MERERERERKRVETEDMKGGIKAEKRREEKRREI